MMVGRAVDVQRPGAKWRLVALVAAMVLLLVACGGGDDPSDASSVFFDDDDQSDSGELDDDQSNSGEVDDATDSGDEPSAPATDDSGEAQVSGATPIEIDFLGYDVVVTELRTEFVGSISR